MEQVFERALLVLIAVLAFSVPSSFAESSDSNGLFLKVASINESGGSTAKDVLGWVYIYQDENESCHTYYAALPPYTGMTEPIEIPCPLSLQIIDNYTIEFSEAIDIMYENMNNSDKFAEMSLSWPLTPESPEPLWIIKTSTGREISIGADSGEYFEQDITRGLWADTKYAACFAGCAAGCLSVQDEIEESGASFSMDECITECGNSCYEDYLQ